MKLIDKKKFAKATLDEHIKAFMMHVSFLSLGLKMTIHPALKAPIVLLLAKKVILPAKYLDFTNVFSKESAEVLPKCTEINEHAIKLKDSK